MDASRIFPPVSRSFAGKSKTKVPSVRRSLWGTSLDCVLSIHPDGTFVLAPSSTKSVERIPVSEKRTESTGLSSILGSWNVLSNPYCLTDRIYDQISFTSYPRQKIAATRDGAEEKVLQTFQLTMNSRLFGRHNRQVSRQVTEGERKCCGKMTRGTIVWRELYGVSRKKKLHRPVLASFSAIRSSEEPKHEGWIDKEYFGY